MLQIQPTIKEQHDIYSITLGELVESGIFEWKKYDNGALHFNLDWSDVAFNREQFYRICEAFINRYYFDEISITPPLQWMNMLCFKIRYELMPKYKHFYEIIDNGYNPFYTYDRVGKKRNIHSDFPETLLSGNSDYASNGDDTEYEEYEIGLNDKFYLYKDVDQMLIDDLKVMFNPLWTLNMNTL